MGRLQPAPLEVGPLHHLGDGRQRAQVEVALVRAACQQEDGVHQLAVAGEADARAAAGQQQLEAVARIQGMYVPRVYDVRYHDDGTVAEIVSSNENAPERVLKRIVPVLPEPFTRFLVPNIDTVHNRAPIEIMRGCTRGCRFCHAGMVTRPVRERPVPEVMAAIEKIIASTGFEEISLLSLSSSDYVYVDELTDAVHEKYAESGLSLSLPSLRIESTSADLLDKIGDTRRSGFTFAPEAATERMRNKINKFVPDEQVLQTARDVYSRGWRTIKFYFMIGHPTQTLDDVQAGLVAGAIDLVPDPLGLQRREEALHRRIVPAVSRAAHRACDRMIGHQPLEALAGILAALIGVVQQRLGPAATPDRHH